MKNILHIFPLLLIPFMGFAQEQSDEPVKQEQKSYKNQIDLDVELLLSANLSYRRKISDGFFLGGIIGFGLPVGFPWNNRSEFEIRNVLAESFNLGVILNYKISKRWRYEFSPQYSIFSQTDGSDGILIDGEISALGIKNGIFFRIKKVQIGVQLYVGYVNIGYQEENQKIKHFWKLTG